MLSLFLHHTTTSLLQFQYSAQPLKLNRHDTKPYEQHRDCVCFSTGILGMLGGLGSGLIAGYIIQPSLVGISVGCVLTFAIPTISIPLSMYAAYYCIPAEQRTYQPFIFEWNENAGNSDTLLELDDTE